MTSPVLERIYPEDSGDKREEKIMQLHLERYQYAGQNLSGEMIADIACGSGYGSYLLATKYPGSIKKIVGVDNNSEAIEYAKNHYSHPLIQFIQQDAISFNAPGILNTIISLETIEHLENPEIFVKNCIAQLDVGGRFIASSPITPSMDANPYHLQDFSKKKFRKLFLDHGMTEISSFIQIQKYNPINLFGKRKGRISELRRNLFLYYLKHPNKLLLRFSSLLKDGFCNKYLVVVFEKR
ncbi:MAG: methyltransferase domain-containing protein [Bacteroidetes bacterium]|nr:methyltransferase domain-containing protein [Bacteroidota bacterium]MBS1929764.1 methyltransferase domain-containing protein [Bacteroidota bacterium]